MVTSINCMVGLSDELVVLNNHRQDYIYQLPQPVWVVRKLVTKDIVWLLVTKEMIVDLYRRNVGRKGERERKGIMAKKILHNQNKKSN